MRTVDKVIECHNLFHFLPFVYFLSALGRPMWAAFVLYGSDCVISKYCDRCHKKLKIGEKCECSEKLKADEKRDYTNYHSDSFYGSTDWQRAREQCKTLCCGLDLYSLYVKGVIEYGSTVHHIVPIDVDRKLRLTQSNLIYLTESNHRLIHSLYKTGRYSETVELLKNLKKKHIQGVD